MIYIWIGTWIQCQGREPFVSFEGLEQLLRFLFVLGITHVLYSGIAIGLAMSKVHSLVPESSYECYIFILEYFSMLLKKEGIYTLLATAF